MKEARTQWARIKASKTRPGTVAADDSKRIEQDLVNLEYQEIANHMARRGPGQKSLRQASEKMRALMDAGRMPDGAVERACLMTLGRYAYLEGEDDLLVEIATKLIAKLDRKKPQDRELIERLEKQVAKVRDDR